MSHGPLVPLPEIERSIFLLRGQWVMLDRDLARVYGVLTERLNEQVRRNPKKFGPPYAFQVTRDELQDLIPQFAGSKRGGRRKLPYAFTEAGAVMASTVLRSARAIEVSAQVVEVFVRLSRAAAVDREILRRIDELERRSRVHDANFQAVFVAIRKLLGPTRKPRPVVGFLPPPKK